MTTGALLTFLNYKRRIQDTCVHPSVEANTCSKESMGTIKRSRNAPTRLWRPSPFLGLPFSNGGPLTRCRVPCLWGSFTPGPIGSRTSAGPRWEPGGLPCTLAAPTEA